MTGLKQEGYISCQGESGSCAFGASRSHYFNYIAAPQPSFEEVVRRVVERDAVLGMLPVQNSRSGLIDEPLTLLAKSDLFLVGEHHHRIKHHLMAPKIWVESVLGKKALDALEMNLPGNEIEVDQIRRSLLAQVTTVYSDEQGLKQCDRGLKIKLAGADRHLTTCTAKAARMVSHETDAAKLKEREIPGLAAIASEDCATMFKNVLLVPEINDDKNNETRYVAISRNEISPKQMLADIDLKAVLHAFEGTDGKNDLKLLFRSVDKLEAEYQRVVSEFSLGGAAEEAGQERIAHARILRDFLAETDWQKVHGELEKLPDGDRARMTLKLQPLSKQVHDHALKTRAKGTSDETVLRLLRSKPYQSRQRSIFIIRAKDPKKTVADLLRPLIPPASSKKKKDDGIVFHVLAELPKPIDSKDEGVGLIIDAEGCLIGAQKRLKHKKTHSSFFAPSPSVEVSELERALHQLIKFADIRVLGSFAKEQAHLGAAQSITKTSAGTAALPAPGKGGKGNRPSGDAEAMNASGAGAIAALLALLAGAAGVWWYSTHIGF